MRLDARLDRPQALVVEPLLHQRRGHRPGVHHQGVGPPLIELELVAIVAGMGPHEGEQPQVPRRVAGTQLEQLQVPETQVAMVILDRLAPQPQAVFLAQLEGGRIGMRLVVRLLQVFVVVQPRLEALGAMPVGPAVHLHLQNAQVYPQLDLAPAVVAGNDPHEHLVGPKLPLARELSTGRWTCRHCTGRKGEGGRGKAEGQTTSRCDYDRLALKLVTIATMPWRPTMTNLQ